MGFDPNEMMLDLFRSEVESHSEALTNSLLRLERESPDKTFFDSMMRAAHSIKGAARIVGVSEAVDLSHVLEDCFVAAQRGELSFGPNDVDVMLRSVDLIVQISEATKDSASAVSALSAQVQDVVVQLKGVRTGQAVAISDLPAKLPPEPAAEVPSMPANTEIVLTFAQRLDRSHAEAMRARLLELWHAQVESVKFDLSQTQDIDAIGVGFLASAQEFVERDHRAQLHFDPISTEMRLVLRVAGLQPNADVQR